MPQRIYLDHAATSPLRPEAKAAMEEGFRIWANPSSPHAEGRKARAALEDARERIKAALGWDGELIFTSGASEAAALAKNEANVHDHIASEVEHDALIHDRSFWDDIIAATPDGEVDSTKLKGATLRAYSLASAVSQNKIKSALVAMQHTNSETGTIQDIPALAEIVHCDEALLLVDCAQSAGKAQVPPAADMAIVSAHKFGGPVGIGALLVKDFALLHPTGGQERGYRRGTENMPAALGMAAALEAGNWATTSRERSAFIAELGGGVLRVGDQCDYIVPLTHPSISAQALLIRLDAMGFAVSAGSACSSGSLKPSRVLKAFGIDDETASRTIRVSIGWSTTPEELDAFAEAWASLN